MIGERPRYYRTDTILSYTVYFRSCQTSAARTAQASPGGFALDAGVPAPGVGPRRAGSRRGVPGVDARSRPGKRRVEPAAHAGYSSPSWAIESTRQIGRAQVCTPVTNVNRVSLSIL